MAITCWDKFTAIEWTKFSVYVTRFTLVIAVAMAAITWFTYKDYDDEYNNSESAVIGISVYTIFVALILFVLETPFLHCFGAIKRMKDHWACSPVAKGVYYVLLSILMFVYITPCIAAGALLLLSACFEFMAQCQLSQDAADQASIGGKSNLRSSLV